MTDVKRAPEVAGAVHSSIDADDVKWALDAFENLDCPTSLSHWQLALRGRVLAAEVRRLEAEIAKLKDVQQQYEQGRLDWRAFLHAVLRELRGAKQSGCSLGKLKPPYATRKGSQ